MSSRFCLTLSSVGRPIAGMVVVTELACMGALPAQSSTDSTAEQDSWGGDAAEVTTSSWTAGGIEPTQTTWSSATAMASADADTSGGGVTSSQADASTFSDSSDLSTSTMHATSGENGDVSSTHDAGQDGGEETSDGTTSTSGSDVTGTMEGGETTDAGTTSSTTTSTGDASTSDSTSDSGDSSSDSTDGGCGIVDPGIRMISVTVDPNTKTLLHVHWEQARRSDGTKLRFRFEHDEWVESPFEPGEIGTNSQVVLGVPQNTEVDIQVVAERCGIVTESGVVQGRTGLLPTTMPVPHVSVAQTQLQSHHRWMLGAIDTGGFFHAPYFVYIVDRRGRVVWYERDIEFDSTMTFPRAVRDGTHIAIDRRLADRDSRILFTTLDRRYQHEVVLPDMCDAYDLTDGNTVLYHTLEWSGSTLVGSSLYEVDQDSQRHEIWDCPGWAEANGMKQLERPWCYSASVNWVPATNSILMSFAYQNTVLRIHRSGKLLDQWGDLVAGWGFEPATQGFEFPHHPHITPHGELIVSTHLKSDRTKHAFTIFTGDRPGRKLVESWSWGAALDDFAQAKGMAEQYANGNVLANYGTGGLIREITPDGQIAWELSFRRTSGDGDAMSGYTMLIDDLYALNAGPRH